MYFFGTRGASCVHWSAPRKEKKETIFSQVGSRVSIATDLFPIHGLLDLLSSVEAPLSAGAFLSSRYYVALCAVLNEPSSGSPPEGDRRHSHPSPLADGFSISSSS